MKFVVAGHQTSINLYIDDTDPVIGYYNIIKRFKLTYTMMKTYRYIYYRLYRWIEVLGWEDDPKISALLLFTANIILNIFTLAVFIQTFFIGNLIPRGIPNTSIIVFSVLMLGINYMLLLSDGRFKEIVKEFQGEPRKGFVRGEWFPLIYHLGSIFLFCFILFLSAMKR